MEQERQEEVRWRESRQETSLSPEASPVPELPWSKGKELEVAPESEVVQESRRCDSCMKWNMECVRIKVSVQSLVSLSVLTRYRLAAPALVTSVKSSRSAAPLEVGFRSGGQGG